MKTQTATSPTSLNTALTPEDVNAVLMDPDETGVSRSSGRPIAFGYTPDGRYICVVYEAIDPSTLYPVTAFVIED